MILKEQNRHGFGCVFFLSHIKGVNIKAMKGEKEIMGRKKIKIIGKPPPD